MDLGKFEIIEEVGKGGFGIVYKALDKVLDRQIALKVLHPELLVNPNFILRFKQEAQLSARLDHPNILPVYDFGEFEGRYYIVMAYMPDGSLKDLLRKEGSLDKQRSLKIFEQICDGMSYAHSQKIIHRDLKPGNILFDSRGNARISDMGFAKLIHSDSSASMSSSGRMVGTPSYMAPEIWQGKPASSATDVYSLACVLVEMLSGQPLFGGETTPEIMMKHFAPLNLPEDLPEEWKPVLEAALDKNQEERIQTVGEFFEQIKAVELGLKKAEIIAPKKLDEDKSKKEKRSRFIVTKSNKKELSNPSENVEPTLGISRNEQITESGDDNHSAEFDAQATKHSRISSDEDEKKPVLLESKERKGKQGLKAGVIAGIALLAIILGVIIYQIVKRNSPSTAPVIAEVPVTLTATNTAVKPTKTATPSPTATETPSPTATETPAPTATEAVLGIGSMQTRQKDEMVQVYVPEGTFTMGSDDSDAYSDEKPVRTVYLDAYWIDKFEVTNGQYKKCVDANACSAVSTNGATENHPVKGVTWHEAKSYCEWVDGDKGGLPTEAQWEKAARGTDGRNYPWGNDSPDSSYANYKRNKGYTMPIGSYAKGASPYGTMDMAGNVWEWVYDWDGKYDANDTKNPQGPENGSYRVRRGGSWISNNRYIRSTNRYYENTTDGFSNTGFRCFSSP